MRIIYAADIFVAFIQAYMIADFLCRTLKRKHKYSVCMFLKITGAMLGYFIMNYGIFRYEWRGILGTLCMYFVNFWIFDGSVLYVVRNSILENLSCIALDFFNLLFVYPWMHLSLRADMKLSSKLLLGRNVYNLTMFLAITIVQLWLYRNKGKELKQITFLTAIFALCQILIFRHIFGVNYEGLTNYAATLSIVYSGGVILGYLIVTRLFQKVVMLMEKLHELEQRELERRYQYDYYQKAYTRSEEIRDMRHDMRNQLQAIQYLFQSEEEESRRRAEEMVNQLCGKVNE